MGVSWRGDEPGDEPEGEGPDASICTVQLFFFLFCLFSTAPTAEPR